MPRIIDAPAKASSIDLISDALLWQRGFYHSVTDSAQREMPIVY